ncbi:hypothetical protein HPP92_023448 [Vanilla planifolia]|uniref:STICHEL DnaA-N-like alpha-beta domain-containing protein n=1 Tax=Vanilla planifolia TaxID=51239 RepID=A0A835PXA8_VANPL|nr:hypothetical protein HPP92_023448 [Vanilla planifolia]
MQQYELQQAGSMSTENGILIAFIAFADRCVKLRAERYLSSITNSLEKILKCNVEVRLGLIMDDKWISLVPPPESLVSQKVEKNWVLAKSEKDST